MPSWENSEITKAIHNAILDDSYEFIVIHGPPRVSKSTLAMWLCYSVYEDWDKVLSATVFNLPSVLQRMEDGQPCRWPTVNGLHMRVPILNWDDFAVHSGKAQTQHSSGWDVFKGAFDCLGTKIGVLMVNMVQAEAITQQLCGKYTIELTVTSKGCYKFDRVKWLQDFNGFRTKMKKDWIQNGHFDPIPMSVYKEYDALRQDLTQQAFVQIKDALSMDSIESMLKILKEPDIQLLRTIDNLGPIKYDVAKEKLGETYKDTITRCKARSLVIPLRLSDNYYKLELSSLARDILSTLDKGKTSEQLKEVKP